MTRPDRPDLDAIERVGKLGQAATLQLIAYARELERQRAELRRWAEDFRDGEGDNWPTLLFAKLDELEHGK